MPKQLPLCSVAKYEPGDFTVIVGVVCPVDQVYDPNVPITLSTTLSPGHNVVDPDVMIDARNVDPTVTFTLPID